MRQWVPRKALVLAVPWLLVGACSESPDARENSPESFETTSPEALEKVGMDKPGVLNVQVQLNDGDNDVPEEQIPTHVSVLMDAAATTPQVIAVFDSYAGYIDDDTVSGLEVVLDGPKAATLATGAEIHATTPLAEELVEIQHDDDIIEYRREAFPTLPSVYLMLVPAEFDQVVAVSDRYRDLDEIDLVQVVSGGFILIRDEVNEDLAITDARQRFVQEVNDRFGLTGAVVSGRGPLELFVAQADKAGLLQYVNRNPPPQIVGRVVVGTKT